MGPPAKHRKPYSLTVVNEPLAGVGFVSFSFRNRGVLSVRHPRMLFELMPYFFVDPIIAVITRTRRAKPTKNPKNRKLIANAGFTDGVACSYTQFAPAISPRKRPSSTNAWLIGVRAPPSADTIAASDSRTVFFGSVTNEVSLVFAYSNARLASTSRPAALSSRTNRIRQSDSFNGM